MVFFRSVLLVCPVALALAQAPAPASRQATPVPPPDTHTAQIPVVPPPPEVPPETVVLRIGDVQFTATQFNTLADILNEPYRASAKGFGRKQFADSIVKIMTLADEARRRKLDQSSDFQLQNKFRTDDLLARYAQNAINDGIQIDDAALHEYYETHMWDYGRAHARQILIRTQGSSVPLKPGAQELTDEQALAKAQELIRRIKAGEDFGKLAAAESDDTGTAANAGDLGWFSKGQIAPSIEEAAFHMQTGEISDPVRTAFGYHIIQVLAEDFKPFDEVKADLEKKVRSQKFQQVLDELQKKDNVEYNPAFFAPPKK